jgi:hypothetical protein
MSAMDDELREDFGIISDWLLNYEDYLADYEYRRAQLAEARETIIDATPRPSPDDPAPGRNSVRPVSDPPGRKGIRLAALDDLRTTERWLEWCQEVEAALPWKMQIFLRLRREYRHRRGPHGWTAAVQHRYAREIAERLGKARQDVWIESRETFARWWLRIVQYAAIKAAKKGLLES